MKKKEIDRIDALIINELQQDGSLSNKDLSLKVGLSEPAIHVRLSKLIKRGVLKNTRANINLEYFGYAVQVFVFVTVASQYVEKLSGNVMSRREICRCIELKPKQFVNDGRRFQIQLIAKSQDHLTIILKDLFNQVEHTHVELFSADKIIKDCPMSVTVPD